MFNQNQPTTKKGMEKVILGQPGYIGHMQWCRSLSLDTSPTETAKALASHCCSSPTGFNSFLCCKTLDFPWSLLSLHAFLPASAFPLAFNPWFIFPWGSSSTHDPARVPALDSIPPLGRYGTLELTTGSAETVPGAVYWPRSSVLIMGFLHKKGEKNKLAAVVCYGLKLQLFA